MNTKTLSLMICMLALIYCETQAQTKSEFIIHHKPVTHKNKPHTKGTIVSNGNESRKESAWVSQPVVKDTVSIPASANNPANGGSGMNDLKIVIVIGEDPIDHMKGYQQEHLNDVNYLKGLGCQVSFFYTPNSNWDAITQSARQADIFIYSGHGGDPASMMMYINSGTVSPSMIKNDLKLAKNAVVLFNHVCYSAGSSAGDEQEIGTAEAARRVKLYAAPFIENGAAVYYANNYDKSTIEILKAYFANNSFSDIVHEPVFLTYSDGTVKGSDETVELIVAQPYSITGYEFGVYRTKTTQQSTQYTYVNNNPTPIIKTLPAMYDYSAGFVFSTGFQFDKRK